MWKRQTTVLYRKIHVIAVRNQTNSARPVIAIRREDSSVWERRAPLAPQHVRKLVRDGVKVIVQPSNRRAFPMKTYTDAGAIIQEDLSEAPLILGVKQVPIDALMPGKTYSFFSHTIKAQEANMPLLDALLAKEIRLVDYEKMVDDRGARMVAFGKYAGVAGMINTLHGLGLRLLALGHHTPFMHIGPPHNYRNSETARQAIRDAGYEISLGMMPASIGPLTFVFTGAGNVSQGAQEVFHELPHEYVPVSHLPKVASQGVTNKLYATVVDKEDHLVRKDGGKFDEDEFRKYPDRYVSIFSQNIAPFASVIINGIFYNVDDPRLLSIPDAKKLLRPAKTPWIHGTAGCPTLPHRLLAVGDISADPGGSIEFMKECTSIDKPFCLYDAEQNTDTESFAGEGVLVCSIDNMPTQIPRESTDFFGGLLLPHVYEMIKSDAKKPFDELECSRVVKDAVICSNGSLTPNFEYIAEMRKYSKSKQKVSASQSSGTRKVLLLGAGYVSGPVVEYLSRDNNVQITVASALKEEIDVLANKHDCVNPVLLDVARSAEDIENLVKENELVISLLPYSFHPMIAKMCIAHKTNMVTASYVSPEMQALDKEAKEAGITIINEVGVDPGIDHMLAMECFDDVKSNGGKITSFVSYCGGLPAPECTDNPLRYKFSWSPRGVLMTLNNGAKYLMNGETKEISPGGELLTSYDTMNFLPGFNLEGYPNRDSLIYAKLYGIENAKTILRGTLRYKGFCDNAKALLELGLSSPEEHHLLHPNGPATTWKMFMCDLLGKPSDVLYDSLKDSLYDKFDGNMGKVTCIEELGLLEEEPIEKKGTPIDTLSHYLNKRLSYGAGERDLIIMRHDVGVEWTDGSCQMRNIDLVVYGDPDGYSAMAKTVGYPTGIAARMILTGEIQRTGIQVPLSMETYRPILKRLKHEGIVAREKVTDTNVVYGYDQFKAPN